MLSLYYYRQGMGTHSTVDSLRQDHTLFHRVRRFNSNLPESKAYTKFLTFHAAANASLLKTEDQFAGERVDSLGSYERLV